MGLMSLRKLLKDNGLSLKDLEEKLRVYFKIKEKFDKGLSINDDENLIIKIVKSSPGSAINEIYKLIKEAPININYDLCKFDCVINEAVKRGSIGRKGSILY
jgi:hypothetical protein